MAPRYPVKRNYDTPPYDIILHSPLPSPLNKKSHRDIAAECGIAESTTYRFLRDSTRLQRQHIAKLMGTYGLSFDQLCEVVIRVPQTIRTANTNPNEPYVRDPDGTVGAVAKKGRVKLSPDAQRTPPANLNPDQLYEPQTPAQRKAGIPPVKRKMTRDEFSSYDPEPQIVHPDHLKDSTPDWDDWTNPVWLWWDWRLNTRPGDSGDSNKEAYARTTAAGSRASAEFEGDETDRTKAQRTARRDEIYQALIHNQPIPPFDPADPRYVCEPPEPRRRGKGKKSKQTNN